MITGKLNGLENIKDNIEISGIRNLGYEEKQYKGWLDE